MRKDSQHGCTPKDWESIFVKAGVLTEELASLKSSRARATKIGQFFGPLLGREVPIQVKGRTGKAVLRVEKGRSKERRYYFDVSWDDVPRTVILPDDGPSKKRTSKKGKRKNRSGKKTTKQRRNRAKEAKVRKNVGRHARSKGKDKQTKERKRPLGDPEDRKSGSRPAGGGNKERW